MKMTIADNLKSLGRAILSLGAIAAIVVYFAFQDPVMGGVYAALTVFSALLSGTLFLGLGAMLDKLDRVGDLLEVEKKATAQEVENASASVGAATAHD